jgi:hypothetical protein
MFEKQSYVMGSSRRARCPSTSPVVFVLGTQSDAWHCKLSPAGLIKIRDHEGIAEERYVRGLQKLNLALA